jgi:glutamine amidotransferase
MKNKITVNVIRAGIGNTGSIIRVLDDLNCNYNLVNLKGQLNKNLKTILPGVGNFDQFIITLKENGIYNDIKNFVISGKQAILGICVGMQAFSTFSEEGSQKGLALIDCHCKKFSTDSLKVPHVGWNTIKIINKNKLFEGIEKERFYFTHSYHLNLDINSSKALTITNYVYPFVSSFNFKNIYGVQFHPEKSFDQGKVLIKNFIEKC